MKKSITILIFALIISALFTSGCAVSRSNQIQNGYFINRGGDNITPLNWTIFSPDMDNLEIQTYPSEPGTATESTASYLRVTINTNKSSYVYVVQDVKLRKNTIYCLSYRAQLRSPLYPSGSKKVGVHPVILQDKDMPNSPDYTFKELVSGTSTWGTESRNFYFNSNNNTDLTIGFALGSEDNPCTGAMYLSEITLTIINKGIIAESSIHTVVANDGYKVDTTGEILFIILISLAFIGIFVTGIWLLSGTIAKKQQRNTDNNFEIPTDEELIKEQAVLDTPAEITPEQDSGVVFNKNKLEALFSEETVNSDEIISDLTKDLKDNGKLSGQVNNPAGNPAVPGEVEITAVKRKNFKQMPAGVILLIIMLAAVLVRVLLAVLIRGFRADVNLLFSYIDSINKHGVTEFYNRNDTYFSAGGVYMLSVINLFINLFNVNIASPGAVLLLKIPAIAADLLTALVLYKLASKYTNKYFGTVIAGLYMFNPAVFTGSSVWGAVDSVYTFFMLLAVYFMIDKKTLLCFVSYTLAVLMKVNALSIIPIFVIYYGYKLVTAIIFMIKNRDMGFKNNIKKDCAMLWRIPAYTIGAVILFYLLAMPATLSEIKGQFFFPINHLIFWAAGDMTYFSNNAFNFFALLGRNGIELGGSFPTGLLTALFVIIISVIVAIIYITRHNRANIVLLASYSIFALNFFLIDIKPTYLLPSMAILLAAICLNKDRRLLLVYGLTGLFNFINQALVMAFSHNLNNLPDYMFDDAYNAAYNGSQFIGGNAGLAVNIIFGILMFAVFAYYTYLMLEIALAGRRKKIIPLALNGKSFFKSLKSLI